MSLPGSTLAAWSYAQLSPQTDYRAQRLLFGPGLVVWGALPRGLEVTEFVASFDTKRKHGQDAPSIPLGVFKKYSKVRRVPCSLSRILCRKTHFVGANERGQWGSHFHREKGEIAENWMLAGLSRRYFGVYGRHSAVSRRSCRKFPDQRGPGNLRRNKSLRACISDEKKTRNTNNSGDLFF